MFYVVKESLHPGSSKRSLEHRYEAFDGVEHGRSARSDREVDIGTIDVGNRYLKDGALLDHVLVVN